MYLVKLYSELVHPPRKPPVRERVEQVQVQALAVQERHYMVKNQVYLETVIHGSAVSVKAMAPLPVGIDLKFNRLTGVEHSELHNPQHVVVKLFHDRYCPNQLKIEIARLLGAAWECLDEDKGDSAVRPDGTT